MNSQQAIWEAKSIWNELDNDEKERLKKGILRKELLFWHPSLKRSANVKQQLLFLAKDKL